MGEDDEGEEHAKARGGDGEEIDGDQVPDVVGEERAPGLGRGGLPLGGDVRHRGNQECSASGGAPSKATSFLDLDQGFSPLRPPPPRAVSRPNSAIFLSRGTGICRVGLRFFAGPASFP